LKTGCRNIETAACLFSAHPAAILFYFPEELLVKTSLALIPFISN
jgi:hypothetical protein